MKSLIETNTDTTTINKLTTPGTLSSKVQTFIKLNKSSQILTLEM
jgi:hypothetical protein